MKKFFVLFVAVLVCAEPAYSFECERLVTGEWVFGCDSKKKGTDGVYGTGTHVQTVGAAFCRNPTGDSSTLYYNKRFRCLNTGRHDDWQPEAPLFCSDSMFKKEIVENARYELWDGGKTLSVTVDDVYDKGQSNGLSTPNSCIKVVCKPGFVKSGEKCVALDTGAGGQCKESSTKFSSADNCNSTGGSNCLQTGSNTFLYCHTKDVLATIADESKLLNACQAGKHQRVIASQPESYFECTSTGIWYRRTFERCKTGDVFKGGCDGIDGCINEYVDASGNKKVLNATGTGNQLVMDSGMTMCLRSRCKDGWVQSGNKCITNAEHSKIMADVAANKQKCEESYGEWSNGSCSCDVNKNLVKMASGFCECKDASYERKPATKTCEFTSVELRKQQCESMTAIRSGARWTGDTCLCDAEHKIWDSVQAQCIEPKGYAQCIVIADARWNVESRECVCTDSTKELDESGTKCVESKAYRLKKEADAATKKIDGAVESLKSVVDGLEVSKWKSADGSFNTARLVSDMTAGVVLGTAGALITSNVVKKQQIEDGFEDLSCTVGGQTVAEYGDEFVVGVK